MQREQHQPVKSSPSIQISSLFIHLPLRACLELELGLRVASIKQVSPIYRYPVISHGIRERPSAGSASLQPRPKDHLGRCPNAKLSWAHQGSVTCLLAGREKLAAMTGTFACVLGFEISTAGFVSAGSRLGRTRSRTDSWTGFCWRNSLSAPANRAGGELSFVIRPTARARQPEKETFGASVSFGQHRIGTLVAPVDPFPRFLGRHKSPGSSHSVMPGVAGLTPARFALGLSADFRRLPA